jgi:hypothetical protein
MVVRLVARGGYVFFLCVVVKRLASLGSAIYLLVVVVVDGGVVSLVWGLLSGLRKAEKFLESASKIWLSLIDRPRKVGPEPVLHHDRWCEHEHINNFEARRSYFRLGFKCRYTFNGNEHFL